jgi:capsid portal protein
MSRQDARGNGAFKNLFVYAAGGKRDGRQIMPFSQVAAKVFSISELAPIQESLKELKDWLGIDVVRFNPYTLLQAAI